MIEILQPGFRTGAVHIPASKSQAHRLLICAALSQNETVIRCRGISRDIAATADCLNALGAEIWLRGEDLTVRPITQKPQGTRHLHCQESGSTLRFLLPLTGVLEADAVFHMEGRLPQRPLHPLDQVLTDHGMTIRQNHDLLYCGGRLRPGEFSLPGDVSSQYISGLLMALPLLNEGSALTVTGGLESAAYVTMTEDTLRRGGVSLRKTGGTWHIPGGQRLRFPDRLTAEGDWSNAAFFLCMGALSPEGVTVHGLDLASSQGDRAVLNILAAMGAQCLRGERFRNGPSGRTEGRGHRRRAHPRPDPGAVRHRRRGGGGHPDLQRRTAPAEGIRPAPHHGAAADRSGRQCGGAAQRPFRSTARAVSRGGIADACGDHRIAMSAAVAACLCESAGHCAAACACVSKSYPHFWEDFDALKGGGL